MNMSKSYFINPLEDAIWFGVCESRKVDPEGPYLLRLTENKNNKANFQNLGIITQKPISVQRGQYYPKLNGLPYSSYPISVYPFDIDRAEVCLDRLDKLFETKRKLIISQKDYDNLCRINKAQKKGYRYSALLSLFDGCATDDPAKEILEIAKRALDDGIINDKRYIVVKCRYPFSGFEPESLEEVGKRLGVNKERARKLEHDTGRRLIKYLPNPEKVPGYKFYT